MPPAPAAVEAAVPLQCGHRRSAVENLAGGRHPLRARPASMRPPPISGGEYGRVSQEAEALRGFNAATADQRWRMPDDVGTYTDLSLLQCGHRRSAVENGDDPRRLPEAAEAS